MLMSKEGIPGRPKLYTHDLHEEAKAKAEDSTIINQ